MVTPKLSGQFKKKIRNILQNSKTPKTLKQLTTQHQNSKKTQQIKKNTQLKKEHNQKNPTSSQKTI